MGQRLAKVQTFSNMRDSSSKTLSLRAAPTSQNHIGSLAAAISSPTSSNTSHISITSATPANTNNSTSESDPSNTPTTFPSFSQLPPPIRKKIWAYLLPNHHYLAIRLLPSPTPSPVIEDKLSSFTALSPLFHTSKESRKIIRSQLPLQLSSSTTNGKLSTTMIDPNTSTLIIPFLHPSDSHNIFKSTLWNMSALNQLQELILDSRHFEDEDARERVVNFVLKMKRLRFLVVNYHFPQGVCNFKVTGRTFAGGNENPEEATTFVYPEGRRKDIQRLIDEFTALFQWAMDRYLQCEWNHLPRISIMVLQAGVEGGGKGCSCTGVYTKDVLARKIHEEVFGEDEEPLEPGVEIPEALKGRRGVGNGKAKGKGKKEKMLMLG